MKERRVVGCRRVNPLLVVVQDLGYCFVGIKYGAVVVVGGGGGGGGGRWRGSGSSTRTFTERTAQLKLGLCKCPTA